MSPDPVAPDRRTIAIVPVRALEGAKSRLGAVLDAEERRDLVTGLLRRTLGALADAASVDAAIVVSSDAEVLDIGREAGAVPLRQLGGGLNAALDQARTVAVELGADEVVVIPGDLAAISAGAVDALVSGPDRTGQAGQRAVALVTDRHGRGTNALLLRPPDVIPFAFGGDSRLAHAALAADADASYTEVPGPLALDLDTPDDLLLIGPEDPEHGAPVAAGGGSGGRHGTPR